MNLALDDLDRLLSVAVATIDPAGRLLEANAGFLRLLGAGGGISTGMMVGRFFIQPNFAALLRAQSRCDGEVYAGLMTIGEYAGRPRTLRGRVSGVPEGLCVLAEYDVAEFERIADVLEGLSRESVQVQRALGTENAGLKRRQADIIETSLTDPLTGVGNRRKLDQALAAEIARVERTGLPLSAFMADLDHFKRVNDNFGHVVGDAVLARFGRHLIAQTRPTDIAARFGGEEFVVLLPNTGLAQALEAAERVRGHLAGERIDPLPEPVTASFGVAERAEGESGASLLQRIDAALYEAKQSGRNRVSAAAAPTRGTDAVRGAVT
jgi:two-component system cell cycle response regulator